MLQCRGYMTGTRPKSIGHLKMFEDHRTQCQVKEKNNKNYAALRHNVIKSKLGRFAFLRALVSCLILFVNFQFYLSCTYWFKRKNYRTSMFKPWQRNKNKRQQEIRSITSKAIQYRQDCRYVAPSYPSTQKTDFLICTFTQKSYTRIFAPEYRKISGVTFGTHCRRHLQHRIQELSSSWDGQPIDMGQKEGGCCAPFAGGELGPHLTQCFR